MILLIIVIRIMIMITTRLNGFQVCLCTHEVGCHRRVSGQHRCDVNDNGNNNNDNNNGINNDNSVINITT